MSNKYLEIDSFERVRLFGLQTSYRAELAFKLLERFGSIAAEPDGETSSGEPRFKLQEPADLVKRCCDIAEQAVAEFERRDWVRPCEVVTDEQRAEKMGKLEKIKNAEMFKRGADKA